MVELLAFWVLLRLEEGSGQLDAPDSGVFALLENLDVVDPERIVQIDGDRGNAIVPALRSFVTVVQPDLAVGDGESVAEKLVIFDRSLHGIFSFSLLGFLPVILGFPPP